MKIILVLLCMVSIANLKLQAQGHVYFLIDAIHGKKLAYEEHLKSKLESNNKELVKKYEVFALNGQDNLTALFKTSLKKSTATFSKMPENTIVTTADNKLTKETLTSLMEYQKAAYLLFKTKKGYTSYAVHGVAYMENTPAYLTYVREGERYELNKQTLQVNYESLLDIAKRGKTIEVTKRVENNKVLGYILNIAHLEESKHTHKLELVPGLGIRTYDMEYDHVKLVYVNQFKAKDYIRRLKGDPVVPVATTSEPVAAVAQPKEKPSIEDFFSNSGVQARGTNVAPKPRNYSLTVNSTTTTPASNNQPVKTNKTAEPVASAATPEIETMMSKPVIKKESLKPITTTTTTVTPALAVLATPNGFYRVVDGDNLYAISNKHGISIKRLMALNNLNSYEIKVNQLLKVKDDGSIVSAAGPGLEERTDKTTGQKRYYYRVEQGDNLFSVANKFKTTVAQLCILNKIKDINEVLNIDDELIVTESPATK